MVFEYISYVNALLTNVHFTDIAVELQNVANKRQRARQWECERDNDADAGWTSCGSSNTRNTQFQGKGNNY